VPDNLPRSSRLKRLIKGFAIMSGSTSDFNKPMHDAGKVSLKEEALWQLFFHLQVFLPGLMLTGTPGGQARPTSHEQPPCSH
jgi:hypothetical protein